MLALDELQEKRPGSDYYFGLVSAFLGQHGPLPDQADGLLIFFFYSIMRFSWLEFKMKV